MRSSCSSIRSIEPSPSWKDIYSRSALLGSKYNDRSLKLQGFFGLNDLPNQLVNKSKGEFIFNVMCIGEPGMGKKTFLDNLFNSSLGPEKAQHDICKCLTSSTYDLHEGNVDLKLTIVLSVGYAVIFNANDCINSTVDYIDQQHNAYLLEELQLKRCYDNYQDTRVHVCFYLINPHGRGLKSHDITCLKRLNRKVNIIPVIAKSDTLTRTELEKFKASAMKQLQDDAIEIYTFPMEQDDTSGSGEKTANPEFEFPVAIVCSTDYSLVRGKMRRSRVYQWGVVEVENEEYNDFAKLRKYLLQVNLLDIRDRTHLHCYEIHRANSFKKDESEYLENNQETRPLSLQENLQLRYSIYVQKFEKEKSELKKTFASRVKGAEAELKKMEAQIHEKFEKRMENLKIDEQELQNDKEDLEDEIKEFKMLTENATKLMEKKSKKQPLLS